MTTERDPRTRTVLSWLREDTHENPERMLLRALDEVDTTPQRRPWWPARRMFRMNKLAMTAAATATVLVVAIVGYALLPGLGILGPGATPSPSPSLIARGTFRGHDWGTVEFEAFRAGSSVTGRITVSAINADAGYLAVEVQCARTTEDGLTMIGGHVTDGAGLSFSIWPQGTVAAVVLKPGAGAPVQAGVRVGPVEGSPEGEARDCLADLDAWLTRDRTRPGGGEWLRDTSGVIEFGPAAASAPPALPVGPHLVNPAGEHGEDRVLVTIPATGWYASTGGSLAKYVDGGSSVTLVVPAGDDYTVPSSVCTWGPEEEGNLSRMPESADALVADLMAQTFDVPGGVLTRGFSAPVDISIDGTHGQRIVDTVRDYSTSGLLGCTGLKFCMLKDRDRNACLLSYARDDLDTVWVVSSGAKRLYYLVVAAFGSPSTELRAEMNAIVDSMRFVVE